MDSNTNSSVSPLAYGGFGFTGRTTSHRIAFETIRLKNGTPLWLEVHLKRLWQSLQILGLSSHWTQEDLTTEVERLRPHWSPEGLWRLRLMADKHSLWFEATPYDPLTPETYTAGIHVHTTPFIRPWAEAKYMSSTYEMLSAQQSDSVWETLLVNTDGHITEGNKTGVFATTTDSIILPTGPKVPSITLQNLTLWAQQHSIPVKTQPLAATTLDQYQSLWVANVLHGLIPVAQCETWTSPDTHWSGKLEPFQETHWPTT